MHRSPSPHPTSGNETSFPRFLICRGVSLHRLAVLRDAKGVFTCSLSRELSCMILRAVAGVRSRMHVHNTLFQRPDACQSSPCVRALCMAELRRHMSPCGGRRLQDVHACACWRGETIFVALAWRSNSKREAPMHHLDCASRSSACNPAARAMRRLPLFRFRSSALFPRMCLTAAEQDQIAHDHPVGFSWAAREPPQQRSGRWGSHPWLGLLLGPPSALARNVMRIC